MSILDILGLGAGAVNAARGAKMEGERELAATQQQTLMDRLKMEQEQADRALRERLTNAQIADIERRGQPQAPEPIYDRERGVMVDPATGTARPIQGLPTPQRQARTQIVDGQLVDLDTGTARPLQGYTPPAPTARQSLPTEGERKAAAFYASGKQGYDTLESLLASGQEVPGLMAQTAARVGLGAGNVLTNDQVRQMRQSALMLSDAWLRYTSGAAVPEQEVERFAESFIPRAGDDPQTLEQKRQARATIIEALRKGAGRALDQNAVGTQPSVVERYQLEPPE